MIWQAVRARERYTVRDARFQRYRWGLTQMYVQQAVGKRDVRDGMITRSTVQPSCNHTEVRRQKTG